MGAVCPASGEGLIGCHAYSILQVREIPSSLVETQLTLHDYFAVADDISRTPHNTHDPTGAESGTLRLIQLRNPWGKTVWKGQFGEGSAAWGPALVSALGKPEPGAFWMQYHDFLQRFMEVDVCFAHKDWFSINVGKSISFVYLLYGDFF